MRSQRINLDYNATSPLAKKVKAFLASGFFIEANSSAQHFSGKQARKSINQNIENIKKIFKNSESYSVIFHSGASEGCNLVLQGFAKSYKNPLIIVANTDHKCVLSQKPWLEKIGADVVEVRVKKDGKIDIVQLQNILANNINKDILLNITIINNETGVIQELSEILDLKKLFNFFTHVDAAQLIGKRVDWNVLDDRIDSYTFSGHKFGALKYSGMTFVGPNLSLAPLIYGGGQQDGMRSGTENPLAIECIYLALSEVISEFNVNKLVDLRGEIIKLFLSELKDKIQIVEHNGALNTISLIFNDYTADKILPFFDMNGIDVSTGSACNSGSSEKSHVLLAMGYGELSNHAIRLSLPLYNFDNKEILRKLKECIKSL